MMKFVLLSVFTSALVGSTLTIKFNNQLEAELGFVSSSRPGKCPEAHRLPEPLKLDQFLGTWFEIQSTHPIFEKGLRNVQSSYGLVSSTIVILAHGVNDKGEYIVDAGTAKSTELDNVFAVKFSDLSQSAKYWIVDTDYDNYALIVSCNETQNLSYTNDGWILSRKQTLDNETINSLKEQYSQLGFDASDLTETPQD